MGPRSASPLREFSVPYVSARDLGNDVFETYGLKGVQEAYYLDASGRIISHAPAAITRDSLEAELRAALREAP